MGVEKKGPFRFFASAVDSAAAVFTNSHDNSGSEGGSPPKGTIHTGAATAVQDPHRSSPSSLSSAGGAAMAPKASKEGAGVGAAPTPASGVAVSGSHQTSGSSMSAGSAGTTTTMTAGGSATSATRTTGGSTATRSAGSSSTRTGGSTTTRTTTRTSSRAGGSTAAGLPQAISTEARKAAVLARTEAVTQEAAQAMDAAYARANSMTVNAMSAGGEEIVWDDTAGPTGVRFGTTLSGETVTAGGDGSYSTRTPSESQRLSGSYSLPMTELNSIVTVATDQNQATFKLVEILKTKLAELSSQYHVVTTENEELVISNQGLVDHLEAADRTVMELTTTQTTVTETEEELIMAREDATASEERLKNIQVAKAELEATLVTVQAADESTISELRHQANSLSSDMVAMQQTYDSKITYITELESKKQVLEAKCASLTNQASSIKLERQSMQEKNKQLKVVVETAMASKLSVQEQLKVMVTRLEELSVDRKTLQSTFSKGASTKDELETTVTSLEKQKQTLEAMASRIEVDLALELAAKKATAAKLDEAQSYNAMMYEELRILEDNMKDTVSDMDLAIEELASEKKELYELISSVKTKLTTTTELQVRTLDSERELAAKLAAELKKDLGLARDSTQMDSAVTEVETRIAAASQAQVQLLGSLQAKAKDLMASLEEQMGAAYDAGAIASAVAAVKAQMTSASSGEKRALAAEHARAMELVKQLSEQSSSTNKMTTSITQMMSTSKAMQASSRRYIRSSGASSSSYARMAEAPSASATASKSTKPTKTQAAKAASGPSVGSTQAAKAPAAKASATGSTPPATAPSGPSPGSTQAAKAK